MKRWQAADKGAGDSRERTTWVATPNVPLEVRTTVGPPLEPAARRPLDEHPTGDLADGLQELSLLKRFLATPRELATPGQVLAWENFVHACDPIILRIVRRCDGHWDKVDDLHQDVWTTLVRRLPTLRLDPARGTLHQWVAGVARRLAGWHVHRRSRHRDEELTRGLAAMLEDHDSGSAAENERWLRNEQARQVIMRLAATLPERNRRVVMMRWVGGRPVREIARELAVADYSVWAILRRVGPRLRDLLRNRGLERL